MYEQNSEHQQWLEASIASLGAAAGTVHIQRGEDLYLSAALRIPPPVIATVAHVVHGKGMAGAAQLRKAPVQTCNLQDDNSGNIRPGAKAVGAQAAIAIPLLSQAGEVMAVVGFAWQKEGDPADWIAQEPFPARLAELTAHLQNLQ
ncbi:GAF domain-containing protein [Undibacterium sp. TS12]|uniref:GAF domain-containing protein n=1 Tax=Undibacterium sp. TS12 TaxID=2908202 RepID=UPI001F4D1316|nr:GAF domain-containing protein [Undibacterium sp. TS12]MCH8617570.1 GAF domain-containing protein [Undibacterium sp. TS12]